MRKLISSTGAVSLIAASIVSVASMALPTTAAQAESWSQSQCEASGGTYVKNGSDSQCVYPSQTTKPGNMPDGYDGGAATTTQTTTDGQGNLTNQETTTTSCTGHKCPK
jgi:hypothetical protein